MQIPSYQMHNVLNVYTRRLEQNRGRTPEPPAADRSLATEKITVSVESKRQAVIDRVVAGIVERITQFGPQQDSDCKIVDQLQQEFSQRTRIKPEKARQFIFNTIDGQQEKTSSALSADDASFLLERFAALTREVVDGNMESSS